jgi:hypothetical protein
LHEVQLRSLNRKVRMFEPEIGSAITKGLLCMIGRIWLEIRQEQALLLSWCMIAYRQHTPLSLCKIRYSIFGLN